MEGRSRGTGGRGLDLLAKGGWTGLERGAKQRATGGQIPEAWFYCMHSFPQRDAISHACTTRSRTWQRPPGGELGAGKSHRSRQVPLRGVSNLVACLSLPRSLGVAGLRGRGCQKAQALLGRREEPPGETLGPNSVGSIRASTRPDFIASRSEFWEVIEQAVSGLVLLCCSPSCWLARRDTGLPEGISSVAPPPAPNPSALLPTQSASLTWTRPGPGPPAG